MAQQPRISTRFTAGVEHALDYMDEALKDEQMDHDEAETLYRMLTASYELAQDVDAGFQIGIAIIRGGPDNEYADRLASRHCKDVDSRTRPKSRTVAVTR